METYTVTTEVFKFDQLDQKIQERTLLRCANSEHHIEHLSEMATEDAIEVVKAEMALEDDNNVDVYWNDRHGQLVDFSIIIDGEELDQDRHEKVYQEAATAIYDQISNDFEYVLEDFYTSESRFDKHGFYVCEERDVTHYTQDDKGRIYKV